MKAPKPARSKINLRLPEDLKQEVQSYADTVGISFNDAMILAIRNWLPFAQRQAGQLRMGTARATTTPKPAPVVFKMPKGGAYEPCPCLSGYK